MQSNQGPVPSPPMPLPASTVQQFDKFLETWWLAIPGRLRQYSVYLSETWADGIYLTAWPKVAALAPLVLLLFGFLEGTSHWSLPLVDGVSPLTFTQLLPLIVLTAAVSALSTNLGFMLVLGYALGDFLIAGFRFRYADGFSTLDPVQSFLYLHLAQLISYVLFLLLVITPTLSSRYLLPRLSSLTEPNATLVKGGIRLLIQGAIVYSWTLAAPLLIRIFWAWTNASPPLSAAYYLQEQGGWVIMAAVVGVGAREWLSYQARRNPVVTQRIERQASTLRAGDTRRAFSGQLPPYVRAILVAGVSTLLISGFIPSLLWGLILFLFLSFILIARTTLLPSLDLWKKWVDLIANIPAVFRLAAGALASFLLSQGIISFYWNQPITDPRESFIPVLIAVGLSLLIMTVLVPPAAQLVSARPPARPPVPPSYGSPPPPTPAMWSAPPMQQMPPVQQPPPTWQTPPTQPPLPVQQPPPMWQVPPTQPPSPVQQPPPTWQAPPTQPPSPGQTPPAWPT